MAFSRIGVVGLGTMGAGIAEVLARSGIDVVGVEHDDESLERAKGHLAHSTGRAVARGKLTEERGRRPARPDRARHRARGGQGLRAGHRGRSRSGWSSKKELFAKLDALLAPDAVLATNTSALSVTELATEHRPARRGSIGLHWFNPAPVMRLVEVVKTVVTDPSVVTRRGARRPGREAGTPPPATAPASSPTRCCSATSTTPSGCTRADYASREDIDAAMRFGCGHPMGPLALLDLIGLDSAYEILETIYAQSRDHLHAPAPLLKQYVTAGLLGRKTGRGIYTYAGPDSSEVVADDETLERLPRAAGPAGREDRRDRHRHDGHRHRRGLRQERLRRGLPGPRRGQGRRRPQEARGQPREGGPEGQAHRGRPHRDSRRVTGTTSLEDLADCDLVIEAVAEQLDIKRGIFAALDDVMKPGAILATTTSSLPVIECATATKRPGDVIGMHWFNPATVMKLVEVVPTVTTSPDVIATVLEVCAKVKKHPVLCGDRAGFIVNALLFPYLNDGVKMLEAHYATIDDIDFAMTSGCGHPMGPFALMDVVGLDVTLAIQQTLFDEFREPGDSPAPMLEHLVKAGYLGRKTGRGFRDYAKK